MADQTILAIDVGGSHVKDLLSADRTEPGRFVSGPDLGERCERDGRIAPAIAGGR